jgi:endonuclease III
MLRESQQAKRERALAVIDRLDAHMPGAKIELDHRTPLELLVSVILSAQCTDRRVNLVTPALFRRYPTAASYARARVSELEGLIKSCGLYRSKARNLIAAAKVLVKQHRGEIPKTREALETLPGVGHKTAGVVCIHLGTEGAFPVDTHIRRLAKRLGFSKHDNPDDVEMDLRALLPTNRWAKGHQLLIWHGRRTCFARRPACERCVVADLCPKIGVAGGRLFLSQPSTF